MKKGIGIGGLVLIGLAVWWLTKGKEAQAAPLLAGATSPSYPSEYELLHTTVPITGYAEKQIQVFTSFDQYKEVVNA